MLTGLMTPQSTDLPQNVKHDTPVDVVTSKGLLIGVGSHAALALHPVLAVLDHAADHYGPCCCSCQPAEEQATAAQAQDFEAIGKRPQNILDLQRMAAPLLLWLQQKLSIVQLKDRLSPWHRCDWRGPQIHH